MGDKDLATGGAASQSSTWARVYDELRSQQSLSSVTNDPRGNRLLRGEWDGLTDFVGTVWESVEELNDQQGADVDAAVRERTDALVGPVPVAADFQPYLDTFADVWAVHHRNHRRARARRAVATAPPTPPAAFGECSGEGTASSSGAGVKREAARVDEEDEASMLAREAHLSVPHEYFSANFTLEQHQIFRQSLETSVSRQEEIHAELTGHLDLVEVSLFEQIRVAQRDQLFDSLASLGEPLQGDLLGALEVVKQLRRQLRTVQVQQLRCGMAVGRLARRKQRVSEVLQRLDCLAHVRQCQPSIQMLLQGQDYVTALDLLESTTQALDSKLKGLASVKQSSSRLADLGDSFDTAVEADFVHHSSEAFLHRADTSDSSPNAKSLGVEVRGAERLRRLCQCLARRQNLKSALNPTLRDVCLSHLKKALKGQARCLLEELQSHSNGASGAGRCPSSQDLVGSLGVEEAPSPKGQPPQGAGGGSPSSSPRDARSGEDEPNGTAADASSAEAAAALPAVGSSSGDGATAGISAQLCALSFDGFLEFWQRLLNFCLEVGSRFCDYAALVQASVRELPSEANRPDHQVEVGGELLRLLEVIVNSSLKIAGALLQSRQSEHQRLKWAEWQRFLAITDKALDEVRSIQAHCKERLDPAGPFVGSDVQAGLKAIVYTQTKNIIEEFHQKCLLQTKQVLEQERWERTDVPMQYSRMLSQMLGREQPPQQPSPTQKDVDANGVSVEAQQQQTVERYLHVDGIHFLVVPAVLTLLQLLNDYVQLCRDFGDLAAEVVQRMCMLLRNFNQRAQRLVLSGKAVEQKVLEKITAANLALASQSCGLVAQILPLLQSHLLEIVQSPGSAGGGQAGARSAMVCALIADLPGIGSEFAEHKAALFGKLSDLLKARYELHAKKWLSAAHAEATGDAGVWEADGAAGAIAAAQSGQLELGAHESLEPLVRDVTNMYRVLLKHLTGDSVRRIFAKAFEEIAGKFEQRLGQELSAPPPIYEERIGRTLGDRLLLDLAYLQKEFEKLSGISTPLQRLLVDLVQHLQSKLPAEDPLKRIHPTVLEVLQRAGRLPH